MHNLTMPSRPECGPGACCMKTLVPLTSTVKTANEVKIGFIQVFELSEGSWSGGYLITDVRGNPCQFCRTSEPVQLGRLQTLLLGKGLRRYVLSDLIGKSLIKNDSVSISVLIVEQPELLHLRGVLDIPVGLLSVDGAIQAHERFPQDGEVLDSIRDQWDLIDGPVEV